MSIELTASHLQNLKNILLVSICNFLVACQPIFPTLQGNQTTAIPGVIPQSGSTFQPVPTIEPTKTSVERILTSLATMTPWILPSGLCIEEHPLAKRPEIDPLVIQPLNGLTQIEVLGKNKDGWGKTMPPNEFYDVGHGNLWVMEANEKLETLWGVTENGKVSAQVTRNGLLIFSKLIDPPGTTSPFRVLSVYDDHWVLEIAQEKIIQPNTHLAGSLLASEIFVDGQSLNDLHDYVESYGFQTIHGKPFFFYYREDKIGFSYDGQEIPVSYEGVFHYGCCSAGAHGTKWHRFLCLAWRHVLLY
jgi:hypothetical protein